AMAATPRVIEKCVDAHRGRSTRRCAEVSPASSVSFTAGTPETVLPPPGPELQAAAGRLPEERRAEFARIAASWPRSLDAWAGLVESAEDPIDRYAFARVGYHRGLDTLRAAGSRGSGYVRRGQPPD